MAEQTRRLSTRERQALQPHVEAAQRFTESARLTWKDVGVLLDEFKSSNHSQCCPIGGVCYPT